MESIQYIHTEIVMQLSVPEVFILYGRHKKGHIHCADCHHDEMNSQFHLWVKSELSQWKHTKQKSYLSKCIHIYIIFLFIFYFFKTAQVTN